MIEIAVNADDSTGNSRLSKNQIVDVRHFRYTIRPGGLDWSEILSTLWRYSWTDVKCSQSISH